MNETDTDSAIELEAEKLSALGVAEGDNISDGEGDKEPGVGVLLRLEPKLGLGEASAVVDGAMLFDEVKLVPKLGLEETAADEETEGISLGVIVEVRLEPKLGVTDTEDETDSSALTLIVSDDDSVADIDSEAENDSVTDSVGEGDSVSDAVRESDVESEAVREKDL